PVGLLLQLRDRLDQGRDRQLPDGAAADCSRGDDRDGLPAGDWQQAAANGAGPRLRRIMRALYAEILYYGSCARSTPRSSISAPSWCWAGSPSACSTSGWRSTARI